MENSILQRFRLYIKNKGYTIKSYANEIDATEGSINNMFSRGTNPSSELLVKALKHNPKLSLTWLLIGVGEMEIENQLPIGKNSLAAVNALSRFTNEISKPPEKKIHKTTTELIDRISELSAENALLKEKVRALEEEKFSRGIAAEPNFKYGKEKEIR